MAVSRHEMAGTAGRHVFPASTRDDRRQRRMLVREPVRRIEEIVDLRLSVGFGAAGDVLRHILVFRGRLLFVRNGEGPCGVAHRRLLLRLSSIREKATQANGDYAK